MTFKPKSTGAHYPCPVMAVDPFNLVKAGSRKPQSGMRLTLRRSVRRAVASVLFHAGILALIKTRLKRQGGVIVLMLHRVVDANEFAATNSLPGIVLRKATFESLAAYAAHHFAVVSVSNVTPAERSRKLQLALTFDDGWIDNHRNVLPVAQTLRIPITIFICPALVGSELPFWPERVVAALRAAGNHADPESVVEGLKVLPPESSEKAIMALSGAAHPRESASLDATLSWEEITEMSRSGIDFGSHSDTHRLMNVIDPGLAATEARQSKVEIERMLHKPCRLFAYPNGNHSPQTQAILSRAGYNRAFTTDPGMWTAKSDPLAIPRINIAEDDAVGFSGRFSPALFEFTVLWRILRGRR